MATEEEGEGDALGQILDDAQLHLTVCQAYVDTVNSVREQLVETRETLNNMMATVARMGKTLPTKTESMKFERKLDTLHRRHEGYLRVAGRGVDVSGGVKPTTETDIEKCSLKRKIADQARHIQAEAEAKRQLTDRLQKANNNVAVQMARNTELSREISQLRSKGSGRQQGKKMGGGGGRGGGGGSGTQTSLANLMGKPQS